MLALCLQIAPCKHSSLLQGFQPRVPTVLGNGPTASIVRYPPILVCSHTGHHLSLDQASHNVGVAKGVAGLLVDVEKTFLGAADVALTLAF